MHKSLRRKVENLTLLLKSFPLGTAVLIFSRKISFFILKTLLRKKTVRVKIHNYRMVLNFNDTGLSRDLYSLRRREEDHRVILLEELRQDSIVLDIGANIGYYVLMEAKKIGERGKIFAVEPLPDNIRTLEINIGINNIREMVQVSNFAISNKNGMQDFYVSSSSNLGTLHPQVYKGRRGTDFISTIKVKTVDICDFLQALEKIDLMRMDIEGHEVEVFQGLYRLAQTNGKDKLPGKIIFETHFNKYDENSHNMKMALQDILSLGYRAKIISSNDESLTKIPAFGYRPYKVVKDGLGIQRGLYREISNEHLKRLITEIGTVRTVLLSREC